MNIRIVFVAALLGLALAQWARAEPVQPAELSLTARCRVPIEGPKGQYRVVEKALRWDGKKTALVICDVWDKHWCNGANVRLGAMLERMNRTVEAARAAGALIIHAPSDCMDFYKDTPQRKLATSAPPAKNIPAEIAEWCSKLKGEPADPIDSSDGGCDDQPQCKQGRAWKSEHPAIRIADNDAVSDKGVEVWNLLESRGIENVMILGVHTNMCISGRPFGLRNLSRYGKNVVLIRDLTDTMYNPRKTPQVAHERGTALFVEHVEKYICPTVLSSDLLGDARPAHVLLVIGEDEYSMAETLPEFAKSELDKLGIRCTFAIADAKRDRNDFGAIERAKDVDLLVIGTRRRTPTVAQLDFVRQHLAAGKPLIGIRTASHGFAAKPPDAQHASWDSFDRDVFGEKYEGHFGSSKAKNPPVAVSPAEGASGHPILAGWPKEDVKFSSTLYKSHELATTTTVLLYGAIDTPQGREPVAWTNTYKGGRIFYTSLGSADDFADPAYRRMLRNAVLWALERAIPD